MKKTVIVILLIIGFTNNFAQNDAKAKKLLDEVSLNMTSYKTIYVEFKNTLENIEESLRQDTKGTAYLKGEKYLVNFLGTTTIFDGTKNYLINPEDEEVNISNPEDSDEITPAKFFSFYKEGYNYSWDILQNINGLKVQFVKLIPIASDSEMKYVLLGIDSKTKNIYKLIQVGKNGTNYTLTITKLKTNLDLSNKLFEFNKSKYETEGYIINDL
ncbi:MAG TPA: outer membrane lipoprotein carrier protein LolA [Flavobacteriaceae bacterium]|nr:outer membrane lipoprotein carrier protein LolA [Flavobacteriaceae bacterium]